MLKLVPTPIGNISDISLRAMDALSEADILLCEDTRVTKKLLNILKERYSLKTSEQQFISLHYHNEKEFVEQLEVSFFDQNIVYVSDAGMPGISDPAQLLVEYCLKNSVEYDVLPGANAVLTAFVASGFVTTQMLFFGFLAHKGKERNSMLNSALHNGYTTVLYEAPHRLKKLLEEIKKEQSQRVVFLAKEITKKYQKFYKGTASELLIELNSEIKGEWVVVIEAGDLHQNSAITKNDIEALELPKKTKAKLISKITGENIKDIYTQLQE
ncbi:MAG: 16S rRNA (cytidine(1402)-2'-O)-methyltransferase [Helicobacteraceae bacterium]|nr:16S rRNA (cytidine(1402)-2'-O)-methyltransferase [Helicobacteraceae bacterium]